MSYDVRQETLQIADYIRIRREAGLSAKSEEAASIGLKNSLFGVVVYEAGTAIGMGRVVAVPPDRAGMFQRIL